MGEICSDGTKPIDRVSFDVKEKRFFLFSGIKRRGKKLQYQNPNKLLRIY